jgi:glycosyltransferase involved in cell wall biosynthesis
MSRVLFIASHRKDRAPGQRFRFEQYLPYLEQHGIECELSPIISEADDRILYQPGRYLQKLGLHLRAMRTRRRDVARAAGFDVVFVFREAILTGSTAYERRLRARGPRLVFDFDDAIWNLDVSDANRRMAWLKNPGKTAELIAMADLVFAGNAYLADYARRHNDKVVIVPTTIDTDEYVRAVPRAAEGPVCIGWSGSVTTIKHFEQAVPALRALRGRHGSRVSFKVIGDASYVNDDLGIRGLAWTRRDEIAELSTIDIGIMPLPDDEWARGKCGLKGLQYMALEIPTVMSPVGVNGEIVRDGENGFLASSTEQWVETLSRLVESPDVRVAVGAAGRRTVEERYSVRAWRDEYVRRLWGLAGSKAR